MGRAKYKEMSFGRAEAVFNKLGGNRGVDRFLRGELEVREATNRTFPLPVFDPSFVGDGWKTWKCRPENPEVFDENGQEDIDPRARAVNEVNWNLVRFLTMLRREEKTTGIKGQEKTRRMRKSRRSFPLDCRAFSFLWEDWKKNGANSVLEWLRKTRGITYVDFLGQSLRSPNGLRFVLSLYWYGGVWFSDYRWLGSHWYARNFSAALASV